MFDLDATLRRLGGDHELLAVLVRVFVDDAPRLVARIETSAREERWDDIHRAAHSLRGLAANLDATVVIERALEVEHMTAAGKPDASALQQSMHSLRRAVILATDALGAEA